MKYCRMATASVIMAIVSVVALPMALLMEAPYLAVCCLVVTLASCVLFGIGFVGMAFNHKGFGNGK